MKIAFLVRKLAGRSGGAERILIETANEMAARGFQVEVLSYENRGIEPFYRPDSNVSHLNLFDRSRTSLKWEGIKERFGALLPSVFPFNHIRWRLDHGGLVRALRAYVKREKPDVLISFMPPSITPSAVALRGLDTALIASTHNEPSQDYENRQRWDANPVDIRLRKKVLSEIDKTLVLLPEYKEWYTEDVQGRVEVIPNPVKPVSRTLLVGAQREKLILGVGRLVATKQFEILIESWLDLHRDFPDWKVEIYGDGPGAGRLKSLVRRYCLEDAVFLKGVTDDISTQYLRASILCHPSKFEGFPLAVTEALAHGVPVVGFSDCSGLNSLVKNETSGLLVEPSGDRVEAFTSALARLIKDEESRLNYGANAVGSMAHYEPTEVYDQWENAIREAAGTRRN